MENKSDIRKSVYVHPGWGRSEEQDSNVKKHDSRNIVIEMQQSSYGIRVEWLYEIIEGRGEWVREGRR